MTFIFGEKPSGAAWLAHERLSQRVMDFSAME